jgi:hypothetical protein
VSAFLGELSDQPYIDFSSWLDGQWTADKLKFTTSDVSSPGFMCF